MTLKKNWTEVKKQLRHCSERDLVAIIQDLYKLNRANKDYLHLKFLAGSSAAYKANLIEVTVGTIRKKWASTFHDPYGYSGKTMHVKITPMKDPVMAYKKAIGIDDGYVIVLAEYIIHGYQFLKTRCAEPSDTVINSINVMARELFLLIEQSPEHIISLDASQTSKICEFIEDYEAYDETKMDFKRVKDEFLMH